jgi:hypothetical protein
VPQGLRLDEHRPCTRSLRRNTSARYADFHDLALARDNDGWRIRGNGELRTFRLPAGLRAGPTPVAWPASRQVRAARHAPDGGFAWFASENRSP